MQADRFEISWEDKATGGFLLQKKIILENEQDAKRLGQTIATEYQTEVRVVKVVGVYQRVPPPAVEAA